MDTLSAVVATVYTLAFVVIAVNIPSFISNLRLGMKKSRFTCMQCGNCCRFKLIEVTQKEAEEISEKTGRNDFTNNGFMKRDKGLCIFLENDRCVIHPHRPKTCRNFPFTKLYGLWMCQNPSFCPGVDELKKQDG